MRPEKDVIRYSDYRAFLLDFAQWKKAKTPNWSYGIWAKRLGLKTTSSITKVLQGRLLAGRLIRAMRCV